MSKVIKRNAIAAARVEKVAELTGFSKRYVRMVLLGERDNETIMRTYMFLYEGENKLLQAAKKLMETV